ncbi:hypothetical protein [Devosia rhizoryzae]|uniref:Tetratricopeptide repeat protein n=1 Tax=Devosia rhizoryzae TaxID=2774137 RepID=A0ABX7C458_9HYPH|nr:hypothetical protein [Devosia rhizoryzae]QQR39001.1 hypothetical protein JI748_14835 [Devosia rhizoryzae]
MFGLGKRSAENKEQGEKLFKLGMKAAVEFRSNEAINYYSQSIAASPNPSPYMNRANLLGKRVRHYEALQDLLQAQKLDRAQGKQFGPILDFEIARTSVMTSSYTNGLREKLIADLKEKGPQYVAQRLLSVSFNIPEIRWDYGVVAEPMIEFHFFNELDNIIKFDDLALYPEVAEFAEMYPAKFIDLKLEQCPDLDAYQQQEVVLHGFLCSYPQDQMVRLRRSMLYQIHEQLLTRDFGALHMSLTSECNGIIKEAEEFISPGSHKALELPPLIGGFDASDLLTEDGKFDLLLDQITQHLMKVIAKENHVYRYIMEEADLLAKGSDFDKSILAATGITPIEYQGESDKFDEYSDSRPGADYLNGDIIPDFEALIGNADKVRGLLLAKIYGAHEKAMCRLRLKYAQRYRDVCIAEGDLQYAQEWSDAISSIEARLIVLGGSTKAAKQDDLDEVLGSPPAAPAVHDPALTIGGISISKKPETEEELLQLVQRVAPEIAKRLPMEQDFYWFLIEQYDRMRGKSEYLDELLDHVGLHPIEYQDMRSEESYVGKPNPGVAFFRDEVVGPLSGMYDEDRVDYVSTVLFTGFCQVYAPGIAALREKYATHYHNNCVSQGSFNSADRWVEVLDSL